MGGAFWSWLLGSNVTVALVTGVIARKKDAGDLSNNFAKNLMTRLEKVEAEKDECNRRTTALEDASLKMRNEARVHAYMLKRMVPELHRANPFSPTLAEMRNLLDSSYFVAIDTPVDMLEQLDKLND